MPDQRDPATPASPPQPPPPPQPRPPTLLHVPENDTGNPDAPTTSSITSQARPNPDLLTAPQPSHLRPNAQTHDNRAYAPSISALSDTFSLATTYTANSQQPQPPPRDVTPHPLVDLASSHGLGRTGTRGSQVDDDQTIINQEATGRWGRGRMRMRRLRTNRPIETRKKWTKVFRIILYVILALWLASMCLGWAGPWLSDVNFVATLSLGLGAAACECIVLFRLRRCIKRRELELPSALAFLILAFATTVAFFTIAIFHTTLPETVPVVIYVQASLQLALFILAGASLLAVLLGYVSIDLA